MRAPKTILNVLAVASGMCLALGQACAAELSPSVQGPDKPNNSAQSQQDVRELVQGVPVEREMAGGEAHLYQATLGAGQYMHVVVEQRGIDVVVTAFGTYGRKLIEMDSPNGTRGPEAVSVVADAAGVYRLEVRSLEKKAAPGRYEIKVEELRESRPQDRVRLAAERAFAEGNQMRERGTAESKRNAIERFGTALQLWQQLGERRGEAFALNRIGGAYRDISEWQKALDYFNRALTLCRETGDRQGEALALTDMGQIYPVLGESQKALDYLNEALPLLQAIGDHSVEAVTLISIGWAYLNLGEYQQSLSYFGQALPLCREIGNHASEAYALYGTGLSVAFLGEPLRALDYFGQSLALSQDAGDHYGQAQTLNDMSWVYWTIGEYQKALDYSNQALPLNRSVGNRSGEAYSLNNTGLVYWSLGELPKALDYLNKALQLRRAIGARRGEAQNLHNIGKVYQSLGDRRKALEAYSQALKITQSVKDRGGEANTLLGIATVERDDQRFIEARTHVEAALDIIESLRTRVAAQEFRTSYLASNHAYYEFYIDLLMRMHEREPANGYDVAALQASERARARSLLETLTEAHADIRQGVDPALLERERRLRRQLNDKERVRMQLLGGKHTEEQAAAMEKGVEDLLAQYQDVQAQIRATSPRYAALTQPVPLSLKEIQQQVLDPDTLLLEYSLGEERSYLWAVTPTSIDSFVLPKRTEIEAGARRVYELLTTSHQREPKRQAELAAAGFGRMVLGPVMKLLGRKRLLIVSDGALQYVPFSALQLPEDEDAGIKNDRENTGRSFHASSLTSQPLMVEHEIVSLPSASVLAVLRRETAGLQPAANTVAVLADAVFRGDDPRVQRIVRAKAIKETGGPADRSGDGRTAKDDLTRSATESGLTGFERLRFTRQEAEAIVAQADGGRSLKALDFAASRATVTTGGLDRYRMVHFATHGILNNQHPELSGVVLSLVDEQGRPQDGFLRAHDIYNLKLRADLVVLSACQTALGKEIKGEGLVGLTRGFMYAGAARVVASLWDVKDEATAELMKRFYRGMLREGLRPAAALRAAQVSMWKEKRWEAPYYWAGFVLQGEWK